MAHSKTTPARVRLGIPEDREALTEFASDHQWAVLDGGELPFPVAMSIGVGEDGRLRCTGLILGAPGGDGTEITSASLRRVRVTELLRAITSAGDQFAGLISYSGPHESRPFLDRLLPGMLPDLPPAGPQVRGGALPRSHFEAVAAEYRRALKVARHAPMTELRRRLTEWQGREIPEPTARRWVQRARDMGLLGTSRPGKAGEYPAAAHPQKAGGFLRYSDDSPAAEDAPEGSDSPGISAIDDERA